MWNVHSWHAAENRAEDKIHVLNPEAALPSSLQQLSDTFPLLPCPCCSKVKNQGIKLQEEAALLMRPPELKPCSAISAASASRLGKGNKREALPNCSHYLCRLSSQNCEHHIGIAYWEMQAEVDVFTLCWLQGCSGLSVLKGEPAASRHQDSVLVMRSAMQILPRGCTLIFHWRLKNVEASSK